mmetsp:Transcript_6142/g.12910  ORF Transcript_6142/g.12910 Transcript_6142/m.12910 type:complete len:109 (-) Transcript_6142:120-446(-)
MEALSFEGYFFNSLVQIICSVPLKKVAFPSGQQSSENNTRNAEVLSALPSHGCHFPMVYFRLNVCLIKVSTWQTKKNLFALSSFRQRMKGWILDYFMEPQPIYYTERE